jgi:hypothetical protein
MKKVYIVIEDSDEYTTKLVTTDSKRAHKLAQALVETEAKAGDKLASPVTYDYGRHTLYSLDLGGYYVRVEEHALQD